MNNHTELKDKVEYQIKRIKKAERERPNLISQTIYIGTLGLVMVLPVVAGVYLGRWFVRGLFGAMDLEFVDYWGHYWFF